jgi:HPt (histidine-containing phosphotransfer) domain-containing protein
VSYLDPTITAQLAATLPQRDVLRILRTFEADLDRLAHDLAEAVAAGDADACRRAAHSLAGTAASIGAQRLEAAARAAMEPAPAATLADLAVQVRQEAEAAVQALAAVAEGVAG